MKEASGDIRVMIKMTKKYIKAKEKALMQHGIDMAVYEAGFSSLAEMRDAYRCYKKGRIKNESLPK